MSKTIWFAVKKFLTEQGKGSKEINYFCGHFREGEEVPPFRENNYFFTPKSVPKDLNIPSYSDPPPHMMPTEWLQKWVIVKVRGKSWISQLKFVSQPVNHFEAIRFWEKFWKKLIIDIHTGFTLTKSGQEYWCLKIKNEICIFEYFTIIPFVMSVFICEVFLRNI